MKITKAVIPCGGLGSRFLPITKAVPKEILPIIDKPVLSFIIDELVLSGITEVLIVLGTGKEAIRDYFVPNARLESALSTNETALKILNSINNNVSISFAVQPEPKGSGDAVAKAKDFTKNQPFIVCNGDDVIIGEPPAAMQLAKAYESTGKSVLGVQTVCECECNKYGIIKPNAVDGRIIECADIVEKPKKNPPSCYAALGRYVFTPDIYTAIDGVLPDAKGEIQLTEAVKTLMKQNKVCAYDFIGKRYDMGDKFGAVTATIDYALKSSDFGDKVLSYIKDIADKSSK